MSEDLAVGSLGVISNIGERRKLSGHFGVVADLSGQPFQWQCGSLCGAGGPHRICSRVSHRPPEDELPVTVVSWNIAKRHGPWRQLLEMNADVALLQEGSPQPDDVVQLRDATLQPAEGASLVDIGPREAWDSHS